MVTQQELLAEASGRVSQQRKILEQARQTAEQQRQQLESRQRQLEEQRVEQLTATQLRKETGISAALQRGIEEQKVKEYEAGKQAYEKEVLKPYEEKVAGYEKQLKGAEAEIDVAAKKLREFAYARKLAGQGIIPPVSESKEVREMVSKMLSQVKVPTIEPLAELRTTRKGVEQYNPETKEWDVVQKAEYELPTLTFSAAPTELEKQEAWQKEYGKLTGSLSYIGEKVSGALTQFAISRGGYQAEAFGEMGRVGVQIVPYLHPVTAGATMIIKGIETYTSPAGKRGTEAIKQELVGYGERIGVPETIDIGKGWTFVPSEIAKLRGAGEIALGVFTLGTAAYKGLISSRVPKETPSLLAQQESKLAALQRERIATEKIITKYQAKVGMWGEQYGVPKIEITQPSVLTYGKFKTVGVISKGEAVVLTNYFAGAVKPTTFGRKGMVDVTYQMPKEVVLVKGALGDIVKKVKLPKLIESPFITAPKTTKVYSVETGIAFGKGPEQVVTYTYQLGAGKRPINIQLGLTKTTGKYAEIFTLGKGKGATPLRITEYTIAKTDILKGVGGKKGFVSMYQPKFVEPKIVIPKRLTTEDIFALVTKKIPKKEIITAYKKGPIIEQQTVLDIRQLKGIKLAGVETKPFDILIRAKQYKQYIISKPSLPSEIKYKPLDLGKGVPTISLGKGDLLQKLYAPEQKVVVPITKYKPVFVTPTISKVAPIPSKELKYIELGARGITIGAMGMATVTAEEQYLVTPTRRETLITPIISLQEKQMISLIPKTKLKPITILKSTSVLKVSQKVKEDVLSRIKQAEKLQLSQKQLLGLDLKLAQKTLQETLLRTKQVPRQAPRTRITTAITTKPPLIIIPSIKPPEPQAPSIPQPRISKIQRELGYQLFVKRFGRWISKGVYQRVEAIKKGELFARTTLGASFKILPSKTQVKESLIKNFEPSPNVFRKFRIIKGRRVSLKDEWIQRASKRLSARSEITEIQRAKSKRRNKKRKWL